MAAALGWRRKITATAFPTQAVLCLETGGVRLQEANLGLGGDCRYPRGDC